MKRVLVIGAGNRIQNTVLPALFCLEPKVDVVGICSKSRKKLKSPDGKSTFTTITDMNAIDYPSLDAIIVAVTTNNVPDVLRRLTEFNVEKTILFLDTPVLRLDDLRASKYFNFFGRVYVSEDYPFIASFNLVKQLVKAGTIGRLRHIYLFHNGYNHHALAILKHLTSNKLVSFAKVKKRNNEVQEICFRFPNGVEATVIKPRDYGMGRFLVTGESGFIADYQLAGNSCIHLEYMFDRGVYRGVRVKEKGKEHIFSSAGFNKIKKRLLDVSLINCQKIEGLVLLFSKAFWGNPHSIYRPIDGVYDNTVSVFLHKYGIFKDFKLPFSPQSVFQKFLSVRMNI